MEGTQFLPQQSLWKKSRYPPGLWLSLQGTWTVEPRLKEQPSMTPNALLLWRLESNLTRARVDDGGFLTTGRWDLELAGILSVPLAVAFLWLPPLPYPAFRYQLQSVQFSCSVVSNSLQPHEPQHTRPPCPSPTPGGHPNPCPSSQWCHPTISSSVIPISFCPQSFPASGSFPVSQLFTSGGQSIGFSASTSVLPMNIQEWFPFGLTGLISLQSKGLSRVFTNTTVQTHQLFGTQLSL